MFLGTAEYNTYDTPNPVDFTPVSVTGSATGQHGDNSTYAQLYNNTNSENGSWFYTSYLNFDPSIWDGRLVPALGYPRLRDVGGQ